MVLATKPDDQIPGTHKTELAFLSCHLPPPPPCNNKCTENF